MKNVLLHTLFLMLGYLAVVAVIIICFRLAILAGVVAIIITFAAALWPDRKEKP